MLHETRVDARTVQTKRAIRQALEEMIGEMDYPQITVSGLTKRAGLHRKTFYLHYASIEALFYELADEIVEQVDAVIDRVFLDRDGFDFSCFTERFGRLLGEKPRLHRRLFCNSSYSFVYDRIQRESTTYLYQRLRERTAYDFETLVCAVTFLSYGSNAIWRNHYAEDIPRDPQKISSAISTFTEIAWRSLSIEPR